MRSEVKREREAIEMQMTEPNGALSYEGTLSVRQLREAEQSSSDQ